MISFRSIRFLLIASVVLNVALFAVGSRGGSFKALLREYKYSYLAPRIFAQSPNDIIINFTYLRSDLRNFVEERKDMRVGLYFEYLPSGISIGVNEKESFVSASLLKTPFIMGLLRQVERGFLNKQALITIGEEDLDRSYGTLWKEGAGYRLTVKDAVRRALTESDNTAVRALDALMPEDMVVEVFGALDIPLEMEDGGHAVTTPKNYASVFRCLYLSCYLKYDGSQEMLSIMTQSKFHDGIPEGIPSDIPFAHKVGIFDLHGAERILRLDCGIVYVPKRPYLLCLFIEGEKDRQQEMFAFAEEVSRRVYRFVAGADGKRSLPQYDW